MIKIFLFLFVFFVISTSISYAYDQFELQRIESALLSIESKCSREADTVNSGISEILSTLHFKKELKIDYISNEIDRVMSIKEIERHISSLEDNPWPFK